MNNKIVQIPPSLFNILIVKSKHKIKKAHNWAGLLKITRIRIALLHIEYI